ncbi:MAG: redoxin domain-containing protein, partial [Phycisphaerae bacterium]|nr:redoxin domain-containing protein [Phycisphaerae bacterium]
PGARGCTPQACGFRDLHAEVAALGVRVWGVSTSTPAHQAEFVRRMGVPYPLLSDCDLSLTRAMKLPMFRFPVESGGPDVLIRRMAWFVEPFAPAPAPRKRRHAPIPDPPPQPRIVRVWYPVFPPDRCAAEVLAWLTARWGERRGAAEGAASTDRG